MTRQLYTLSAALLFTVACDSAADSPSGRLGPGGSDTGTGDLSSECTDGEYSPSVYLGDCCPGTDDAWACNVSEYVCREGVWEATYEHCDCFCPDAE